MPDNVAPQFGVIAKRQFTVAAVVLLLLALVVGVLYWKDRQREWRLREEQVAHRLELAEKLITRDLERVRSDILYIANQPSVRSFNPNDLTSRQQVETDFSSFLRFKRTYQQVRLINRTGREAVRVDLQGSSVFVVPQHRLQDKKNRYYVRESLKLMEGEVFVSEFDLNQEYGAIEQPLNPVIRFVTPVANQNTSNGVAGNESPVDDSRNDDFLLVANYKGAPLLNELAEQSLPGATYLVRGDGQFLLGPETEDAWGWLLGHEHSFANRFPQAWNSRFAENHISKTVSGAFSFREIHLKGKGLESDSSNLLIVSHLPADEVFSTSRKLLGRLLLLVAAALAPLLVLTRFWAVATSRRKLQHELLLKSEQTLRELSSRLVKIQEDERRSISREIHDQLGQQATAINLDLKLALREAQSVKLQEQLRRIIAESAQLLDTLHDFASRIRPVELDDLGLRDAIESRLWEFKDRSGIQFEFDSNVDQYQLPTVIAENVYRLIQESLNNILKHSNATFVKVGVNLIRTNATYDNALIVTIQDDGVGLTESIQSSITGKLDDRSRLGILGMRERVDLLGGTMEIKSEPGAGTAIEARVPVGNLEPNE